MLETLISCTFLICEGGYGRLRDSPQYLRNDALPSFLDGHPGAVGLPPLIQIDRSPLSI